MEEAVERTIERLLAAGDLEGAATEAVRGYGRPILQYLCGILRDPELARDAFSAYCEKLWLGIGGFRGECSFRTWAYRVAWNAARDLGKEGYRRRARRLATTEISKIAAQVRDSTPFYSLTPAKARLAKLSEHLAPEERSLLTLRAGKGLSWKEVAQVMTTPERPLDEAAVKMRFVRLKKKLRELARRDGLRSE